MLSSKYILLISLFVLIIIVLLYFIKFFHNKNSFNKSFEMFTSDTSLNNINNILSIIQQSFSMIHDTSNLLNKQVNDAINKYNNASENKQEHNISESIKNIRSLHEHIHSFIKLINPIKLSITNTYSTIDKINIYIQSNKDVSTTLKQTINDINNQFKLINQNIQDSVNTLNSAINLIDKTIKL